MKIADVRYVGPMRSHIRRGPSGEQYHFRNPMGGDPRSETVESLADARELASQDVFEVSWTAQGEIAKRVGNSVSSATDALADLSYRQKQKLVSALDADVKGNAPESEMEEALEPMVDELLTQMETQR